MIFTSLFRSRFNNCPLLTTMQDVGRDRDMKLYYIGRENLVGVDDGVDMWIAPVAGCFHNLPKDQLTKQIQLAHDGKLVEARRKLLKRRV